MIETPDRLNIKEFALDRPEPQGAPFNPVREITDDDWHQMNRLLGNLLKEDSRYGFYTELLLNMFILFPKKINLKEIANDEEAMKRLTGWNQPSEQKPRKRDFLGSAVPLKVLFPKHKDNLQLSTNESRSLSYDLKRSIGLIEDNWSSLSAPIAEVEGIAIYKFLFPGFFSHHQQGSNLKNSLVNNFNNFEEQISQVANFGANIRLLYPETVSEVQFDAHQWSEARATLHQFRGSLDLEWLAFARIARNLKIMAAEEIEFGYEQELNIIMPEFPLDQGRSEDLPEMRSF